MQALHDDLASGMSLHEAMRLRNLFFPRYYVDMIKVGETTGTLSKSLAQLQEHLAAERSRSTAIWGWISYLAFVAIVQLWALLMLSLGVYPEYTEVLRDLAVQPPAPFQIMADFGAVVAGAQGQLGAIVLALLLLMGLTLIPMSNLSIRIARRPFKAIGSNLPFLRSVIAKSDYGQAARVLERLSRAGVPVNEALHDCADLEIAPAQQSALRNLKRRVEEGSSLAEAVAQDKRFPDSFSALISLGESSGKLPSCFERIADLYEQQTLKTTRILVDTICPLGVLVLAGAVLLFELSVFTFLTAIADSIGGFQ
jgi:type IV pilus assembly protein PilC